MMGQTIREGVRAAAQPGSPHGRSPYYRIYQCGDDQWLMMAALTDKFHRRVFHALGLGELLNDPRIHNQPAVVMTNDADRRWLLDSFAMVFRKGSREHWLETLAAAGVPAAPLGHREDWLDHEAIRLGGLRAEVDDPERGHVTMPGMFVTLHSSPGSVRGPAPRLGEHNDDAGWRTTDDASHHEGSSDVTRAGPLEGYRVVDSGTMLAGPMTGSLLAELGADVIKVETLSGDPFRDNGYPYNRGMRSLSLNFVEPRGKEVFAKLISHCDVYVTSMRTVSARALGLDYDSVRQWKEDIVYDGITAFGEMGPYRDHPGFDPVLQAMSGMMYGQGGSDEPVILTSALNDVSTATLGVFGIVVALWHRESTGEGQYVGASLAQSSLFMQSGELASYVGRPAPASGARDRRGSGPDDQYYEVADGWVRVAPPGARSPSVEWGARNSVAGNLPTIDDGWRAQLNLMTASEAVDVLSRAGIPAVKARTADEILSDRDLMKEEYFQPHEAGPEAGTAYLAGRIGRFSRTGVKRTLSPPGLGEHSVEILVELGIDDKKIESLLSDGVVKTGERLVLSEVVAYR
jgi:crotonobetainyl-CoA:carnitine CoA-transferase CaiB-like acyl-CoA transferase